MQRQSTGWSLFDGFSAARGVIAASVLALAACGGSSSGPAVSLSGTVSGLTTSGLSLTTLGVNLVVPSGATTFTFGPILNNGVVYTVTAPNQPAGQLCTVTNGTGMAATANITNVVVTCSDKTFNIGGTISGLTAPGLVLSNGTDTLSVAAGASSFTMPTAVAYGSSYDVTVSAQPTGLTCDVTNGTGTVAAAAVTNIAVKCSDQPMTVGGSIGGLGRATGLVLASGNETYAVEPGATSFTLDMPVTSGSPYAVRVLSQPAGLTCSASKGQGTMPTHDVTDVAITCSEEAYSLVGTVDGLTAPGLVLSDGSDSYSVPVNSTHFTMPAAVAGGSDYSLSVEQQPAGLTCSVSHGNGTMPASESAAVICAASSYTLGGSILGLRSSGLVLTDGTDHLSVSANATRFSMPNALAEGSDYAVTVKVQPTSGNCRISRGTGTMNAEVATVQVACGSAAPP